MTTTMNISLTDELAAIVNAKVQSGLYNNASEVMREGLRALIAQEEKRLLERDLIRKHIMQGLEQAERGEFSSLSVMDIAKEERS